MSSPTIKTWTSENPPSIDIWMSIDILGVKSGESQELKTPITSSTLFSHPKALSESQTIYTLHSPSLLVSPSSPSSPSPTSLLGYAKTGLKDLWFYDPSNLKSSLKQYPSTLALLDIYVDVQRKGYGKILMDHVYESNPNSVEGRKMVYDRPSRMLPGFLKKNYGLEGGEKQNNGFMLFKEFFD
ncbi:hypothetical protein TrLO_g8394 [Triparma laevis f. longispina]|uniref:N-acetyltransferase domain-containing protein n=1 Tax=Triparma laevis f. longispina TaxID=1714387 RepID=A0A9W7EJL5_9STRA|nr:hypothetical protein TrLO_g8394 [Triparma laevis f. longispina]